MTQQVLTQSRVLRACSQQEQGRTAGDPRPHPPLAYEARQPLQSESLPRTPGARFEPGEEVHRRAQADGCAAKPGGVEIVLHPFLSSEPEEYEDVVVVGLCYLAGLLLHLRFWKCGIV